MVTPRATIALLLATACQVSCLVLQAAGARPRAVVASRCSPAMSMEEGDAGVGKCKWFDVQKGFGFIDVENQEQDLFVHQTDIKAKGFRSLAEGEALEFKVSRDAKTGKLKAIEVTGPGGDFVEGAPREPYYDDDGY